jgi:hypothetical protein
MDSTQHGWRQEAIEARRLDATRSHLLYVQSRLTFLFPVIAAVFLCALLRDVAGRPVMLAWLVLVIGLTLARLRMLRRIRDARTSPGTPVHWLNVFALGALVSGALWGAAPMLIVPDEPGRALEYTLYRGLVMLVVCGLVAGATVTYVVSVRVWLSFTIPALLVPGLYLVAMGDRLNGALGGFVLLYLFFITVAGLRMNAQLRRYLELEYEMGRLRRDLAATHGPAE